MPSPLRTSPPDRSEDPPPPADRGTDAPSSPAARRRLDLRSAGPVVGLVLCFILFTLINPRMATIGTLGSIVETSAVLMVIAVGLTFVILLGAIDLSVEGVVAASVLVVATLVANDQTGSDLGPVAVLIAIGVGSALGMLNGLLNTWLRIPSFIGTLGVWFVGLGVATVVSGGVTPTIRDAGLIAWGTQQLSSLSPLTLVAVIVVVIGYVIQRFTRLGRYTFAIGGSEEIARLSGIPVARYKVLVFTLAGTCYGIAGVMLAVSLRSGNLTASTGFLFSGIAAVVVGGTVLAGGRGGVLHSVVGVLLISVISTGMVLAGMSPLVQRAVEGVLIVSVVAGATWSARHRMRIVK